MRRLLAVVPVLAMLALVATAGAEPTIRSQSVEKFGAKPVKVAEGLHAWAAKHGYQKQAGRKITVAGMPTKGGGSRVATHAEFKEYNETLDRWKNPPPPPAPELAPVESYGSTAAAPTTDYSGGSGNATVQCESGGDYSINTGNGYYGGYQFDSGTWDAYGDSAYAEAHLAPPAVQDQAAASVPYDAWPNC